MKYLHLASQARLRSFEQIFGILEAELDAVRDAVEVLDSYCTCTIEAVGDTDRMYASVKKGFTLLEESTSENLTFL